MCAPSNITEDLLRPFHMDILTGVWIQPADDCYLGSEQAYVDSHESCTDVLVILF